MEANFNAPGLYSDGGGHVNEVAEDLSSLSISVASHASGENPV
jgi:hypothetical protein